MNTVCSGLAVKNQLLFKFMLYRENDKYWMSTLKFAFNQISCLKFTRYC